LWEQILYRKRIGRHNSHEEKDGNVIYLTKDNGHLVFIRAKSIKDGIVTGKSGYWVRTRDRKDYTERWIDHEDKIWFEDYHLWARVNPKKVRKALGCED
jgi:hypothetical protein